MAAALLKIRAGEVNAEQKKVTLTATFLKGKAVAGDFIFLKKEYFSVYNFLITEVRSLTTGNEVEVDISFHDKEWMWEGKNLNYIREINDLAFCGISIEAYNNLEINQKIDYFDSIIELLGKGRVTDFVRTNILLANKLLFKHRKTPIDKTKFGGYPIASRSFIYPKDKNGKAPVFLGQIDLSEYSRWFKSTKEFKKQGILYFFASIVEESKTMYFEDFIVVYSDQNEDLVKIELPEELKPLGTFREFNPVVSEEINIPSRRSSLWKEKEMMEEEASSFWYITDILNNYNCYQGMKLLGHPRQVESCVLKDAELKSRQKESFKKDLAGNREKLMEGLQANEQKSGKWRLLFLLEPFTLFEDKEFRYYFNQLSDMQSDLVNEHLDGTFYIMIRQEDLDAMNFDTIETLYQSA